MGGYRERVAGAERCEAPVRSVGGVAALCRPAPVSRKFTLGHIEPRFRRPDSTTDPERQRFEAFLPTDTSTKRKRVSQAHLTRTTQASESGVSTSTICASE